MSQYAVGAILRKDIEVEHPAAVTTAKYCLSELETHGVSEVTTTLQTLTLLKQILPTFPHHMVKVNLHGSIHLFGSRYFQHVSYLKAILFQVMLHLITIYFIGCQKL